MRDLTNRVRRRETQRGDVLARLTERELDALIADLESTDPRRQAGAVVALEGRCGASTSLRLADLPTSSTDSAGFLDRKD